jgi:hypothetical protein
VIHVEPVKFDFLGFSRKVCLKRKAEVPFIANRSVKNKEGIRYNNKAPIMFNLQPMNATPSSPDSAHDRSLAQKSCIDSSFLVI